MYTFVYKLNVSELITWLRVGVFSCADQSERKCRFERGRGAHASVLMRNCVVEKRADLGVALLDFKGSVVQGKLHYLWQGVFAFVARRIVVVSRRNAYVHI